MLIFYKHTSFRSVFTCFSSRFNLFNPMSLSLNPIFRFFFTYDSYIHLVFTPLNIIFIHLYSIKFKFYCCFRYFLHFITAFSCLDGTKKTDSALTVCFKEFLNGISSNFRLYLLFFPLPAFQHFHPLLNLRTGNLN